MITISTGHSYNYIIIWTFDLDPEYNKSIFPNNADDAELCQVWFGGSVVDNITKANIHWKIRPFAMTLTLNTATSHFTEDLGLQACKFVRTKFAYKKISSSEDI